VYLFHLLLVFLLPYRIYGEIKLCKRTMQSLDFTIEIFLMTLFKTSNMETVNYCQTLFGCELPSTLLKRRFRNLLVRCNVVLNMFLCLMRLVKLLLC